MALTFPFGLALVCSSLAGAAVPTVEPAWAASLDADNECTSDDSCALGLAQLRSSKVHAGNIAGAGPSRSHQKVAKMERSGSHASSHSLSQQKVVSKAKSNLKSSKASQEAKSSQKAQTSQKAKSSQKAQATQKAQASQDATAGQKTASHAKTSVQAKGQSTHKASALQKTHAKGKTNEGAKGGHSMEAKTKATSKEKQHEGHKIATIKAFPDYGHPSWLASCKRIFLDVGANIGVSIRKLFEAEKYPGSKLLPFFDEHFGAPATRQTSGDESGLCALGMEPNAEHRERLQALEEAYSNNGWHVHFYPFAAWSTEGELPLNSTSSRPMLEADVFHRAAHLSMHLSEGQPVLASSLVRTVNLANFIESLPAGSVSLAVMDIEGAEYETLAQLMMEKKLCQSSILNLLVEAHEWGDISKWGGQTSFSQGVHPRSTMAIGERLSQMAEMGWCPEGDNVTYVAKLDDPSYATDVDENFGQR